MGLLHQEGCFVNHKRVERIWKLQGLKVLAKQPKHLKAVIRDGAFLIDRLDRTAQLAAAE